MRCRVKEAEAGSTVVETYCSFTSDAVGGVEAVDLGGRGLEKAAPAASCHAAVQAWGQKSTKLYYINVDGASIRVYCDEGGVERGDGTSAAHPASSCSHISTLYPGAKPGVKFIGDSQLVCGLDSDEKGLVTVPDGSIDHPAEGALSAELGKHCDSLLKHYDDTFTTRKANKKITDGGPFYAYGGGKTRYHFSGLRTAH